VALTFTSDHRKRRTLAVGKGIVTLGDIILYLTVCVRDQVYDFDQVIDLRGVTSFAPDPEHVLRLVVAEHRRLQPETVSYTALIATPDSEMFTIARRLSRAFARDGVLVRVFSTEEPARQWLDRLRPERNPSTA
jgi:hypothetical protein